LSRAESLPVEVARGTQRAPEPEPPGDVVEPTASNVVAAYVALTKPRIIELLLITTVPAMVLAADGWPSTLLVLWTLIGGTLAAGGANAINCYVDRDIDEVMGRTRRRPLPMHRVPADRGIDCPAGFFHPPGHEHEVSFLDRARGELL